ncbi:uncharacterized protein THITE_2116556 [Thermothielavioides terrestris NRRL 8126]|uniref:Sphingomyelin phosphodiesterase n=1 Tax=Thermothielavioides terrestris (strain ATCC 38088 / NRRL 8126) TaxID=578455 RepID=G2R6Q0_THETT|nr:uncharacterized protein THITE_2116556 [Thermothielavioides terrestris NRRL 8126]AEO67682.1 hypothetical protein THITE_2116556 [Thermothielavioides terrestris NRRL 8126]
MRVIRSLLLLLGCSSAATAVLQDKLQPRSTLDTIEQELEAELLGVVDCAGCHAALGLLKLLAVFGDSAFSDVLADLCTLSKAEDADVCKGILEREGPIIAQRVRALDLDSDSSQLFCTTFLGVCSYPDIRPFPVKLSQKPANVVRPAVSGQTPIKVVHYSDIHVDPFYEAGSNYNCTKPICCRPYADSDAPGKTSFPAGPNGEHTCDAPISLEESMYAAIRSVAPDAAFALFTGDIVDHAIWNTTQAQNVLDINDAYSRMAASGLPLVFGTAGNHESNPTNAYETAAQGSQAQWVYDALNANWAKWFGSGTDNAVEKMGAYNAAYTSPAGGKLRVINLNTNLYYIDNFYLYEEPMELDPSGQWAWLVAQLDAAEKAGDRVYIIGHMPMGVSDAFREASNFFDQIVNRYQDTIAAMFFGHTHADHFQLSYSDYSAQSFTNAVAMSYIVPSLTPTSGMPAFRIYTVDPVTFAVLDAETYIADTSDPSFQTASPVWKKYYSAKAAYGPLVQPPVAADDAAAELSPAFWHNVTAALAADQAAFDAYYARKSRGWAVSACTGDCVTNEICALRAARSQDNCAVLQPGLHFAKRAAEAEAVGANGMKRHRDECGVPVAREALAALATKDGLGLLRRRVQEGVRAGRL